MTAAGYISVKREDRKKSYQAFIQTVEKEKPAGVKGEFILSSFLTSTMGVSYKLKLRG